MEADGSPKLLEESDRIRQRLKSTGRSQWGFTVYRCCAYDDEPKWQRFMDLLDARARRCLEVEDNVDMITTLNWDVQSNPIFQNASVDHIRRVFRETTAQLNTKIVPGYSVGVLVDDECIDTCLNGPQPPDDDDWEGEGYVIAFLAENRETEDYDDDDDDDEDQEEDLEVEASGEGEDGELSDGGSRASCDKNWMKVGLRYVPCRLFSLLLTEHWDDNWVRPPAVCCP